MYQVRTILNAVHSEHLHTCASYCIQALLLCRPCHAAMVSHVCIKHAFLQQMVHAGIWLAQG